MSKVKTKDRKQSFTDVYANCSWGTENLSGPGSSLQATTMTREIILKVIKEYDITTIVDVACGDFIWMPLVLDQLEGSVKYTGCDIVESLVIEHKEKFPQYNFQNVDFVADEIPEGDLIICRDVLQHLPVKDIIRALKNFSESGAKYLLASTHIRRFGIRNRINISRPGRCKDRNLIESPFNLPSPIVIYSEQYEEYDKFLGLWKLPFK